MSHLSQISVDHVLHVSMFVPHKLLSDLIKSMPDVVSPISRYATGRDYHKIIRNRLQKLAEKISKVTGEFGYRAFTDSAPVLEKAVARNSGLGWIGKHTNLINPDTGSWFFLGEIYTDLPLPVDEPFVTDQCGSCTACIDVCPTKAIVGPYQVDARRCISYFQLTIRIIQEWILIYSSLYYWRERQL